MAKRKPVPNASRIRKLNEELSDARGKIKDLENEISQIARSCRENEKRAERNLCSLERAEIAFECEKQKREHEEISAHTQEAITKELRSIIVDALRKKK